MECKRCYTWKRKYKKKKKKNQDEGTVTVYIKDKLLIVEKDNN